MSLKVLAATAPAATTGADGHVVVVGDVMTDLVAHVDGPSGLDPDGVGQAARVATRQGGAGANVAHWLAHLGWPTTFVGSVGADPLGREAVEVLTSAGVDVRVRTDRQLPTGTRVVLVGEDGDASALPDAGANSALTPEDLPLDAVQSATWLHLSGYTLLNPGSREAGLAAVQAARLAGVPTSVDAASAAPLQAVGGKEFLRLTEDVDLAFCTLDEAEVLCDSHEPSVVAARLTATYPQLVLRLGTASAMWCSAQDVGAAQVVTAPAATAVIDTAVVDTTGAGDAFSAAYLATSVAAARLTAPSLPAAPPEVVGAALERACALAADVAARLGSRPGGT
jgi:sugar/nucleoside kinase (ribokinase family)